MAFLAGFVIAPTAFRTPRFVSALGGSSQPVVVPDVASLSRQDARRQIESAGLVLAGEWAEYGPNETAGLVIRQDPAPGAQVPRGSPVSVFWNVGPLFRPYHPGMLPGLTASEAEELIASWQLYTAGRSRVPHASVPEGRVIAVFPPNRDSLSVQVPVRLLVSTGWQGVPLFVGMKLAEAESISVEHEIVLLVESFSFVPDGSRDSLVSFQSVSPGAGFLPGDTVSVRVDRSTPAIQATDSTGSEPPGGWGEW